MSVYGKKELIDNLRKEAGLSKVQAVKAVDTVLETIKKGALEEGKVQLIGFGSFVVRTRPAKEVYNPLVKKTIKTPEKKVVGFKPGKTFKDLINPEVKKGKKK